MQKFQPILNIYNLALPTKSFIAVKASISGMVKGSWYCILIKIVNPNPIDLYDYLSGSPSKNHKITVLRISHATSKKSLKRCVWLQ